MSIHEEGQMFGRWWSNPYAWTLDKICELRDRALAGDLSQLAAMAMLMAAELSHDQLQSLFQNAMDDDGYFSKDKPEDTYKKLLAQGWDPNEAARQVDFEFGFEEIK